MNECFTDGVYAMKKKFWSTARCVLLALGVFLVTWGALGLLDGCRPSTPVVYPTFDAGTPTDGGPDSYAPMGDASVDGGAVQYRGTNLSGAEFGTAIPGDPGTDYQYPDPSDVEYFRTVGFNHFRLPFRHERLQPKLQGPLDEAEWVRLSYVIDYATTRGIAVTLCPMNGFRHNGVPVSTIQIGDFWGRVAQRVAGNARVSINPTNEPNGMTTEMVVALNQATLKEVRRVGFTGDVMVPGNAFTGGGHWTETWYGTPNSALMDQVGPGDAHVLFEVHQYLDTNADGKGTECVDADVGVRRLTAFVAWSKAKGRKAWLGEFAGRNTPTCQAAVAKMLAYVEASGVFVGWDWWGAGVWSFATTYPFSIGPAVPAKPQLTWLVPFVPGGKIPQ